MSTMRFRLFGVILVAVITCTGGEATPAPAASRSASAAPAATLQELMETRIDPAADSLWDSVAFIASEKGEEDRRPRTPAEWAAVRNEAEKLIEAATELEMPGRRVSTLLAAPGPGELSAADIQLRIDADFAAFAKRARVLQSAAQKALAAIDAKDADALMNAGGVIDAACEACHIVYWYPQQLEGRK
jgi:cytochrome c556